MIRRIFQYTLLMAAVLAGNSLCFAADGAAFLKSVLNTPEKIWLGQQVDLNITLYTTTSFSGTPRFDTPKDSGLVIIVDDSHPLLGSETIDGISYLSKQYTISLFPLRAGALTLPAFQVEFAYQGEDGQPAETSAATTVQQFTVMDVPNHNTSIPLVTAEALKIDDGWNPQPGKATVGDSFSRTVTMTATGLPGMAFPPLTIQGAEGIAVYPGQPQVSTDTERGDYIGKRVETFSYVCEKPGTYTLPEMKIQWWNPAGQELQVMKLSAVTLKVAPNPLLAASGSSSSSVDVKENGSSAWQWAIAAVWLCGALVLFFWVWKRRHWSLRRHQKTEKALFLQFKRAAEGNDPTKTMQSLVQWLDATDLAGSVSKFLQMSGDPMLIRQISALEASLYSREKKEWSGQLLFVQVNTVRKNLLSHKHFYANKQHALGPLNP